MGGYFLQNLAQIKFDVIFVTHIKETGSISRYVEKTLGWFLINCTYKLSSEEINLIFITNY